MHNADLKRLAVLTRLNTMFRGDHFDVCAITDCRDLLAPVADGWASNESMQILRTIHCVKWRDMPLALRSEVPHMVSQVLGLAERFDPQNMTGKYDAGIGQYQLEE